MPFFLGLNKKPAYRQVGKTVKVLSIETVQ